MRYKTLFRVLLKVLGVLLVVRGVATLVEAAEMVHWVMAEDGWGSRYIGRVVGRFATTALEFGLGAYLSFGGAWVANLAIPGNRPYCPECGYDLSQVRADTCPECGMRRLEREEL